MLFSACYRAERSLRLQLFVIRRHSRQLSSALRLRNVQGRLLSKIFISFDSGLRPDDKYHVRGAGPALAIIYERHVRIPRATYMLATVSCFNRSAGDFALLNTDIQQFWEHLTASNLYCQCKVVTYFKNAPGYIVALFILLIQVPTRKLVPLIMV
jgi:hypothetical protein